MASVKYSSETKTVYTVTMELDDTEMDLFNDIVSKAKNNAAFTTEQRALANKIWNAI